jgi:hypothetical protein
MACGGTALAFYTCICNINSNIQNDRVVGELRIPVSSTAIKTGPFNNLFILTNERMRGICYDWYLKG